MQDTLAIWPVAMKQDLTGRFLFIRLERRPVVSAVFGQARNYGKR